MIRLEKVLKGLKCCASNNYTCDDCPYDSEINCMHSLIEDAFELVKGQSEIINGDFPLFLGTAVPENWRADDDESPVAE